MDEEYITDIDRMIKENTHDLACLENLTTQLRKSNANPTLLCYYEYLIYLATARAYSLSSIRFMLTL